MTIYDKLIAARKKEVNSEAVIIITIITIRLFIGATAQFVESEKSLEETMLINVEKH